MTKRETEAKETWRAQDDSVKQAVQNSDVANWDFGGSDLIKNSERIVKVFFDSWSWYEKLIDRQYGLYDRPELSTWHQGRVILIGDAAHPTSPVRSSTTPSLAQLTIVCTYYCSTSAKAQTSRSRTSIFSSNCSTNTIQMLHRHQHPTWRRFSQSSRRRVFHALRRW